MGQEPHRAGFSVSTHSRLKAAGADLAQAAFHAQVSTHSRLKAAGKPGAPAVTIVVFQHTAA